MTDVKKNESSWTFLTNHAHVLLCLAKSSAMRIRDLALEIGITERAVQRILADLTECGYLKSIRDGRSNTYIVDKEKHLKHPIEAHKRISDLILLIYADSRRTAKSKSENLSSGSTDASKKKIR